MRRAAVVVLLVVAVAAIYGQARRFGFIEIDDPAYVSANPEVLAGLSPAGVAWAFATTREANWHPLTWISLQLDATIGGGAPGAFHVTNVVLHALAAVLLFLLFDRMTRATWRSAVVAALFAVHPIHVESVAWIAERKDVLSAVLGLLALHAWWASIDKPGRGRPAAAVALYAAGLLAKPMLVSLPLLMLLLDRWPLARRASPRDLVAEKIPWLVLSGASCVVTLIVQSHGGATRSLVLYPLAARAANAAVAYVSYLGKTIWPLRLAAFYPYAYDGHAPWKVAAAALFLVTVTWGCWRARGRAPYLLTGWLWYLVSLVPVIGLVQVGAQAMADRYTYLPLIGPFAAIVWGAGELAAALERRMAQAARGAAWGAAAVVLVALAFAARRQTATWADSVVLFEHALSVTDDNAVAHGALATALFHRGDVDRAMRECEAALAIAPDMTDVQSNYTRGLIAKGRIDEADARARALLASRPEDPRGHVNAGLVAMVRGDPTAAEAAFGEALRLDPSDADAHLNLGSVLLRQGRRDEAIEHFEAAVRLRPGDAGAKRALERARAATSPGS